MDAGGACVSDPDDLRVQLGGDRVAQRGIDALVGVQGDAEPSVRAERRGGGAGDAQLCAQAASLHAVYGGDAAGASADAGALCRRAGAAGGSD